jgi:hypothetical protein
MYSRCNRRTAKKLELTTYMLGIAATNQCQRELLSSGLLRCE